MLSARRYRLAIIKYSSSTQIFQRCSRLPDLRLRVPSLPLLHPPNQLLCDALSFSPPLPVLAHTPLPRFLLLSTLPSFLYALRPVPVFIFFTRELDTNAFAVQEAPKTVLFYEQWPRDVYKRSAGVHTLGDSAISLK